MISLAQLTEDLEGACNLGPNSVFQEQHLILIKFYLS